MSYRERILGTALAVLAGFCGGFVAARCVRYLGTPPALADSGGTLTFDTVMARRFIVIDGSGSRRAALEMVGGEPNLTLVDDNSTPRASLFLSREGVASLTIYARDRARSAELTAGPGGPVLALYGDKGKPRTLLGVTTAGEVGLALDDSQGRMRALYRVDPRGFPWLTMYSRSGKVVLNFP